MSFAYDKKQIYSSWKAQQTLTALMSINVNKKGIDVTLVSSFVSPKSPYLNRASSAPYIPTQTNCHGLTLFESPTFSHQVVSHVYKNSAGTSKRALWCQWLTKHFSKRPVWKGNAPLMYMHKNTHTKLLYSTNFNDLISSIINPVMQSTFLDLLKENLLLIATSS